MECPLFPFSELGEWADRVTKGPQLSGVLTITETPLGRGAPQGIPADELARRRVGDERGTGQALVGRLVKGCLDRGIEPRTGMRATRLLTEGTRVVGVRFESAGRAGRRARAPRRRHRHRRLRVGPGPGAVVPARAARAPRLAAARQHR